MRYQTRVIWPPFKGKAYKVVDTSTDTGVGLYRTSTGAERKARAMNVAAATGMVYPATGPARVEYERPMNSDEQRADRWARLAARDAQLAVTEQTTIVAEPIVAPEPSHEAMRLFAPAPNQIPGQLTIG